MKKAQFFAGLLSEDMKDVNFEPRTMSEFWIDWMEHRASESSRRDEGMGLSILKFRFWDNSELDMLVKDGLIIGFEKKDSCFEQD